MPPRNVSSGEQFYLTDQDSWPVDLPMAKIEGKSQCTGEAQYVNDIPHQKGELFAAFVNSSVANCDLDVVDASEALVI
jgi:xanthine dehydrogenase/oxidase